MTRSINLIVIHCSASPNGVSLFTGSTKEGNFRTPVQTIDGWHATRGFKRGAEFMKRQNPQLKSIGYHFVIYTNGAVATGRHIDEIGAHVQGFNANSLSICMVGTDRFTQAQWVALKSLIEQLRKTYPQARICGHRDLSPDTNGNGKVEPFEWLKTCPGFNVAEWGKGGMAALKDNLLEDIKNAS